MENSKFKVLKCDDGKSYIFNHRAFKVELKRIASAAKKEKQVASIEEYEEILANKLAVTPSAIKQWKYGNNGVSDIERVQGIARYIGVEDYKKLLLEVDKKEKKDGRDMNNNIYFEEERRAAREVFNSFITVINAYKDTGAYSAFDEIYGVPTENEVLDINDAAREVIQRSRFDLPKEIYEQLEKLHYEIVSTVPEEIKVENNENLKGDLPFWMMVEKKADMYFEDVCDILKDYVK